MKGVILAAGLIASAVAAPAAAPAAEPAAEPNFPGLPAWLPIPQPYKPEPYKPEPYKPLPYLPLPYKQPEPYKPTPVIPSYPTHSVAHYPWKRNAEAEAEPDASFGFPGLHNPVLPFPLPSLPPLPSFPAWPLPIPSYKAPPGYGTPPKPTQSVAHYPWKRTPGAEEIHQQLARGASVDSELIPEPNPVLVA